ncbi:amidohydrolase family protein [Cyclobacterium sp.]|uniref:amidohydrolase family protein n=1 Tax=Cyclobacterium sp. TaxID=1966343 RepID=UPI0019B32FAA|nr:amidohydrolase family protein [Cyclobacterium sp.]MBD3626987.1 amidohydrolase family protein [Cyclobacterium sp.]
MIKYLFPIFFLSNLMAFGQQEEWYTMENYPEVKKMDVHIHLNTDRAFFLEKAKEDNFRLINVCLEKDDGWNDVYRKFRYGQLQHEQSPHTVAMVTAFAVADWEEENWQSRVISWLDSCFEQGALGVKVWKNIGMVSRDAAGNLIQIDDARFDPIFQFIQDQDKTLMGHLGEPKNCWLPLDSMTTNNNRRYFESHPEYYMYLHPEMPSHKDLMEARDRMLAKNPNLRFVGAHLGSLEYDVDVLARTLDRFPNMSVDLAARMGNLFYQTANDREKVRNFLINYQDRILYGTDLGDDGKRSREELSQAMEITWKRDWEYFVTDNEMESELIDKPFKGLHLPKEVVDKVFYENAVQWFGM